MGPDEIIANVFGYADFVIIFLTGYSALYAWENSKKSNANNWKSYGEIDKLILSIIVGFTINVLLIGIVFTIANGSQLTFLTSSQDGGLVVWASRGLTILFGLIVWAGYLVGKTAGSIRKTLKFLLLVMMMFTVYFGIVSIYRLVLIRISGRTGIEIDPGTPLFYFGFSLCLIRILIFFFNLVTEFMQDKTEIIDLSQLWKRICKNVSKKIS